MEWAIHTSGMAALLSPVAWQCCCFCNLYSVAQLREAHTVITAVAGNLRVPLC